MDDPIRPATRADEAAIIEIAGSVDIFAADEIETMRGLFVQDLSGGAEPQWFLHVGAAQSAGAFYLALDGLTHDVHNLLFIGVRPAERRRGVGRAMVLAAERTAAGRSGRLMLIETSSLAAFAPARALYRDLGYTLDGTIRDYHAPGDDKLIFRKALRGSG